MKTTFVNVIRSSIRYPRIHIYATWLRDMGFVANALVQAVPEPGGMVFHLCNENIASYSELYNSTCGQGGKLIQAYYTKIKSWDYLALVIEGTRITAGGLAIGDRLVACGSYGIVRVRKLLDNALYDVVRTAKEEYTEKLLPAVRLRGGWVTDAGFKPDDVAIAFIEQCGVTIKLLASGEKYSAVLKYAKESRQNKVKFLQVKKEKGAPFIEIAGTFLDNAGLYIDGGFRASYECGVIKLQTLDWKQLGF